MDAANEVNRYEHGKSIDNPALQESFHTCEIVRGRLFFNPLGSTCDHDSAFTRHNAEDWAGPVCRSAIDF